MQCGCEVHEVVNKIANLTKNFKKEKTNEQITKIEINI